MHGGGRRRVGGTVSADEPHFHLLGLFHVSRTYIQPIISSGRCACVCMCMYTAVFYFKFYFREILNLQGSHVCNIKGVLSSGTWAPRETLSSCCTTRAGHESYSAH